MKEEPKIEVEKLDEEFLEIPVIKAVHEDENIEDTCQHLQTTSCFEQQKAIHEEENIEDTCQHLQTTSCFEQQNQETLSNSVCKELKINDQEVPIKAESKNIFKKYKVLPYMKNMN